MARMTEWPHCREWLKPGIHAQSCAMTGHWIMLPPKFNFLQLVPNTTQRHRAQRLLEGHSDNKEKKGNAGKWLQTVMFKEMTEIKKKHILLYVMLFLIQNAIVCPSPASPVPRCSSSSHGKCTWWWIFRWAGRGSTGLLFPLGMDWNMAAHSLNTGTTYSA